jgi:hypothetical protein
LPKKALLALNFSVRRTSPASNNGDSPPPLKGAATMASKSKKQSAATKKPASKKTAKATSATKARSTKKPIRKAATTAKVTHKASETKPKLLSGGNPQIAKADGDAPVQAYIAAMPGWKSDVGRNLDALIVRRVPHVRKAVKWNSPFYGVEGQGWFLAFHCFTKYVKVTFIRGQSLRPIPPGESKDKDTRYLDIYEDDKLDEKLVGSWIRQASKLPGWIP